MIRREFSEPQPLIWTALKSETRAALVLTGHDAEWFASNDATLQVTVVNLYRKLSALGLWHHVRSESDSGHGCLHFDVVDLGALKEALAGRPEFTTPGPTTDGHWQSRELRATGALHFKHFDGWPPGRIQAHIDPSGLWLRWWWWLLPIVPLVQLVRHALGYHGYRDVVGIRAILDRQGFAEVEREASSC